MNTQPFYTRTNGADPKTANNGVWPRFYVDTIPDEPESRKQGRRCYKEEERVEVYMPGNNLTIPVFKVTDEHRERWPREYEAFKAGLAPPVDGVPLEEWPALNRAQILELKYLNFRTVDDIINASDASIQKIGMGGRILQQRAKAFLDDTARIAIVEKTTAELTAANTRVSDLETQVKQQADLLNQLQATVSRLGDAQPALATRVPGHDDPSTMGGAAPAAPAGDHSALGNMQPSRRTLNAKKAS